MSERPTLLITPRVDAAPAAGGTLDVLVRVQAPDTPDGAPARAPLRLALVIDRSGSMGGEPLQEALRCVAYIAERLTPRDAMAVVTYDDEAQVVLPLVPGGDAARVRAVLEQVREGGATALFDGWQTGVSTLQPAPAGALSRVVLLSDGVANRGRTEVDDIAQRCAEAAGIGISTTTVGLGRNFNEALMLAMGQRGGGRQYYGQTAADLFDSFDEELALLHALCARRMRVTVVPAAGVIVEALTDVRADDQGAYPLADLANGAEVSLALRLHLTPWAAASNTDPRALLAVRVDGETLDGTLFTIDAPVLALPSVDAAAYAAMPESRIVFERVLEALLAKRAQAIRAQLRAGNREGAAALLAQLRAEVRDHAWLHDKVEALQALIDRDVEMANKELAFVSHRMGAMMFSLNSEAYSADETDSASVAPYLRRKRVEGQGRRRS